MSGGGVVSHESFIKYLQLLDQFYPDWDKWDDVSSDINKETILIPDLLDLTKKIVGPTANLSEKMDTATFFEQPSGFKLKFAKKGNIGNLKGDNGEYKFQEKFASLKIGGILIANVSNKRIANMVRNREQDPEQQDFKLNNNPDIFETDFIFLHPKMGIYVVEVKSGHRSSVYSRQGKKQLKKLNRQLKDFFEECTGNSFLPEYFATPCFRAICETEKIIDNRVADWIDHIDADLLDDKDGLKTHFTKYIELAPERNLFKDKNFRRIVALLVGYRGVPFMSLAQNAIFITENLRSQLLCPINSRNKTNTQNESMYDEDLKIYLTPEQQKAVNCPKSLQVIYGPPGTGKTTVLMKKLLHEARNFERRDIPLVVMTWDKHRPVFESLIYEHQAKFFHRRVQVGFSEMSETERCQADVIRDELGFNNLSFLEWRLGKKCAGMKTIFALTGHKLSSSNNAELLDTISVLKSTMHISNLEVTSLSTVMRGSKKIIEYWLPHLRGYPKVHIGHNFYGKIPEIIQCYSSTEVIEAVQKTLITYLRQNISPKHIAIITPPEENYYVNYALTESNFEHYGDYKIRFGNVSDQIKQENTIVVDNFGSTLSYEWPIVVMCSTRCAQKLESFKLVASSRAMALLVVIERDYLTVQNVIDRKLEEASENLDLKSFVSIALSEFRVLQSDDFHREVDKHVVSFHTTLTILRHDIVEQPVFTLDTLDTFETFTECLSIIYNNDMLLRKLISYSYTSYKMLLSASLRLSNDFSNKLSFKIRISERQYSSFFKFALKNVIESKLIIYENFLKSWGSMIEKIAEKQREIKIPSSVQNPCTSPWNLIVDAADFLISNRCRTSFEYRIS